MNYRKFRNTTALSRYMKQAPDGDAGGGGTSGGPAGGGSDAPASVSPSGDGGAAPSVGSTPSTNTDGAPPSPDPWSGIGSDDDLDFIEVPPTPAQPTAPVVPPAPAQPVAPATPPTTPTTPEPVTPTPPATAQSEPEPLSPSDPVGIANAMDANRNEIIAHLATGKFALTQEEVQELETDVVTAVPKLMAKMYLESQMAMQKFLAQSVPGMIQNHTRVTRANSEAEEKFFSTNKHLGLDSQNAQHRQTAVRLAKLYRQANPQMPLDQLISEIGPVVAAAVRATPSAAPAQPGSPAPVVRGGVPFRPAVGGGGGASPAQAVDENPWAGLGQTYD